MARRKVPNYGTIIKAYDREIKRLEKLGQADLARATRRCLWAVMQQHREELAQGVAAS